VTKIACGHHHTLCVDSSGNIFSWGMGNQGCIGDGMYVDVIEPKLINEQFQGQKIQDCGCGSYHSMVILSNGDVYSWGVNSRGQLGIGNKENQNRPV
jgi:RCC1 and BTB domain-containing protein